MTEKAPLPLRALRGIRSALARRAVQIPLGLLVAAFFIGWIIGPAPIRSGPYLQAVTPTSAIVARIDRSERRVRLRVWPEGRETAPVEPQSEQLPTRFHALQVVGLQPATEYGYLLEDLGEAGEVTGRDAGSFRTAPTDRTATIRFAAVGDTGRVPWWCRNLSRFGWMRARPLFAALGGLKPQWDIARRMVEKDPDFLLHLGDVVYPDGRLEFFEEAFFLPFADLLRTTPAFLAIGNHDTGRKNGQNFEDVFHFPNDHPSGTDLYYTFAWGAARFVVLDSNDNGGRDITSTGAMAKWLDEVLATTDEPWTIVAMHHPFFVRSRYDDHEVLKKHIFPIVARHHVDLVLTGHSHNYQRFEPIEGVTEVIAGGGGHSIYTTRDDPRIAKWEDDYGFLMIEISADRLTGELWSAKGERRDHFVLERNGARPK